MDELTQMAEDLSEEAAVLIANKFFRSVTCDIDSKVMEGLMSYTQKELFRIIFDAQRAAAEAETRRWLTTHSCI